MASPAGARGIAHLVTVGTSVFANALGAARLCVARNQCPPGVDPILARRAVEELGGPCAPGPGYDDAECGRKLRRGSDGYELAARLLRGKPKEASAELNAMSLFIEWRGEECRPRGVERVVLYHSDTHLGGLAASLLEEYLSGSCGLKDAVEVKVIPGLGRGDPVDFVRSLYGLARAVCEDSDRLRSEGYLVALNLTGGFKPEAAFALLAAAAAGGRIGLAYYIHEAHRKPVVVPVPLARWAPSRGLASELGRVVDAVRRGGLSLDEAPDRLLWLAYLLQASDVVEAAPARRGGGLVLRPAYRGRSPEALARAVEAVEAEARRLLGLIEGGGC